MKRLSCLVLVIALLVPALALGEAPSLTTYTNEALGYSIGYPEGWTLLDKSTISDGIEMAANGEIPGMDAAAVQAMKAQIDALDTAMFLSADGAVTFNVVGAEVPMELTNEMIIQSVFPLSQQQLAQAFADLQLIDAGSEQAVGGINYATTSFTCSAGDVHMLMTQLCLYQNGRLFTITFQFNTDMIEDFDALDPVLDAIAGSFGEA